MVGLARIEPTAGARRALDLLASSGLVAAQRLPADGGIANLVAEPTVFRRYRRGQGNAYRPSFASAWYRRVLARQDPTASLAHDLFIRFEPVDRGAVVDTFGAGFVDDALECGLLEVIGSSLSARLGVYVHGEVPLVHHPPRLRSEDGYAYIGRATVFLLDAAVAEAERLASRRPMERSLDIGTGGGYVAIALGGHAVTSVGSDIDDDLVAFAAASAAALGRDNVEFVRSDICRDIDGEFDLIAANPPQSITDPAQHVAGTHDRGGYLGQEILIRILDEAWDSLRDGGTMVVGYSSPVVNGRCLMHDDVERYFSHRAARVEVRELLADYYPEHGAFYRGVGISRIIRGLLVIERGHPYSMTVTRPDPGSMRASMVQTAVVRRLDRFAR